MTELKIAPKLNEKNALLKLMMETQDFSTIVLNPDGIIMTWTLGCEKLTYFLKTEVIGKHISIIYPKEKIEKESANYQLEQSIKKGRTSIDLKVKSKDNVHVFLKIIYVTLYEDQKKLKGFAVFLSDITIQKNIEFENAMLQEGLEERVRQRTLDLEIANREAAAFSYSVSHDLRAPLRAISGYAMMMREDFGSVLNAEASRLLENITKNTTMMGQLVDDLLSFSKVSRLEVFTQNVNMETLVQKCLDDLAHIWPKAYYNICIDPLPACKVDPNMMKQVWMNLIDNALKYSSKKDVPQIYITCKEVNDYNVFSIADNGAGFDMKYYGKLFEVFQRLHSDEEFDGTGLGLALVSRIISKHNGEIWAVGEKHIGATFYFSLPVEHKLSF